jgi:UPF0755 protein
MQRSLRRVIVAMFVMIVIVVVAGGLWFHRNLWGSRSAEIVEMEIAEGSTARDILAQLHAADLMPSELAGRIYLKTFAPDRSLYYGHYRFPPASRPVDVLSTVLDGTVEMFAVTIVEGSDASEIGLQFAGMGLGTLEMWESFNQRTDWISGDAPGAPSLEGFFFPDTYRFAVGISPERIAQHLVQRFQQVWSEEAGPTTELWGSALEIVTLASLVEAETSLEEERPLIAGVFANRLRRGMLLQCDPTVVYALKRRNEWKGRLLRIHWEVDDPYNTYRYPGLPPGPINSPGRAALAAAISPQETAFLYFVAKPGGGHSFSKSLAEHNRAVARLMSSRR